MNVNKSTKKNTAANAAIFIGNVLLISASLLITRSIPIGNDCLPSTLTNDNTKKDKPLIGLLTRLEKNLSIP